MHDRSFDIVLLDLILPDSDEKSSLPRMKSAITQTAIVVLSGMRDSELAIQMVKSGAQDYLIKGDFNSNQLVRVIRYAIERKQGEAELEESRKFLQSTLDGLSAHIAILNEDGVILKVNQAWRSFAAENFDDPDALCEGVNCLSVMDSCDDASARECADGIRKVLKGELDSFDMEYPCHSKDTKRWFIAKITRFIGDGQPRAVYTHENITGRKLAEEELRKHQNNLENIIQERARELRTMVKAMSGREIRMVELKKIIKKLKTQVIESGMTPVADDPLMMGYDKEDK